MSNYGQQDVLRNTCFPGADGGVDGADKGEGGREVETAEGRIGLGG
jgi:hypothetical protein